MFTVKNSKGIDYFLHTKVGKTGGSLFYFSKDSTEAIELPAGFEVGENPKSGLPFVKKKVLINLTTE